MRRLDRQKRTSTELAVIDVQERVLLCRTHGESSWTPPPATVLRLRPTRYSVIRVLDPLFSHWYVAVTPVVGRYAPPSPPCARVGIRRTFVVRRTRMKALRIRPRSGHVPDVEYIWHPLAKVENDLDVRPRELGALLRGYLEGWIPDGLITLVE